MASRPSRVSGSSRSVDSGIPQIPQVGSSAAQLRSPPATYSAACRSQYSRFLATYSGSVLASSMSRLLAAGAGLVESRRERNAHLSRDPLQDANPFGDRWMGVEHRLRALLEALDGIDDVQVLRRAVGDLEHLGIVADHAQRPRQTDRVPGQVDRAHVGELLAASADRKLHEAADERR